ncbi:baseplate J/gp47 family protein, partial [Patescibacteria group bacterium]|nr:baseplate J/gp47 family protein [Patescibacteria group bacterium]
SRAVAFGAATQMGFEVLDPVSSEIKTYHHGQENKLIPKNSIPSIPAMNFGFVVGKDISEQISNAAVNTPPVVEESEKIINESPKEKTATVSRIRLPKISIPSFHRKGTKMLIISFVILLLIGGAIGGAYYFYFNKVNASVLITLIPNKVTEERDVVFTIEDSRDFSNNVLGAKTVNSTLDGDMTIGATGKKDVGDKAKGSVTIYNNNTASSVTLSSGAVIKSESGLEFTLDKDVKVASASGDIFSGTKPGTASVDVTAGDIGTNYNLPSGTKFSVVGNSSMAAKNDSAFSGGSKKTVTVVSKDDLAKLKTELIKSLEDKAGGELVKQTEQDSIVLPIVLSTNVEKTKYDKDAGDEAKAVKLIASVSFTGLSYQEAEARKFAKEILQKNYSKDMIFDENNIKIKVNNAEQKSPKEITASLIMNASLLPKIDGQAISKELAGKSFKEAEVILSRIPQVERTQILYSPNISLLSKLLPRLPNHVTINVSSN